MPRKLHIVMAILEGIKKFHHYEKLCPPQPNCLATRAPKQLIYNYPMKMQGKNAM
jgi:hypothetical protein